MPPDLILYNGKITTLDPSRPDASALAITEGKVSAVGSDDEVLGAAGSEAQRVDLRGRRTIIRRRPSTSRRPHLS